MDTMNEFKRVCRWIGGYCLIAVIALLYFGITAPNGQDSAWHSAIGLIAFCMMAFPFVFTAVYWLYLELIKYNSISKQRANNGNQSN